MAFDLRNGFKSHLILTSGNYRKTRIFQNIPECPWFDSFEPDAHDQGWDTSCRAKALEVDEAMNMETIQRSK